MRGDRHSGRIVNSSSANFENHVYYNDWDEDEEHHRDRGEPYGHRLNESERVGRKNQLPSRSGDNSNPHRHFNGIVREDDDTGDGSSVVSYSSGDVAQVRSQNNNRTNYHEPTVRVHSISREDNSSRYYSPSHFGHSSDYLPSRMPDIPERFRDEKDESEMYVTDSTFRKQRPPGSIYSQYSEGKSRAPSEMSSVKTKTSRKGGVVVETMAAPNPFCPNTKGVCCLMVLVNLGLILVTLGFSIVLQLYDPPFVWYCGIAFLIVGFIGLIASLVFCVYLCRESREIRRAQGTQPGELYWTHHWQKRIPFPGMSESGVRDKDDLSTVYSARTEYDRNQPDKLNVQSGIRRENAPFHSY